MYIRLLWIRQGVKNYIISPKKGFDVDLEKYPNDEDDLHHSLIIKGKAYPGYNGYGIHARMEDIKLAKKIAKENNNLDGKI